MLGGGRHPGTADGLSTVDVGGSTLPDLWCVVEATATSHQGETLAPPRAGGPSRQSGSWTLAVGVLRRVGRGPDGTLCVTRFAQGPPALLSRTAPGREGTPTRARNYPSLAKTSSVGIPGFATTRDRPPGRIDSWPACSAGCTPRGAAPATAPPAWTAGTGAWIPGPNVNARSGRGAANISALPPLPLQDPLVWSAGGRRRGPPPPRAGAERFNSSDPLISSAETSA
jgi:hypothetical protein